MTLEACRLRLAKLEALLMAQRRYLGFIPDPDTRQRAELHLYRLVEMRDEINCACLRLEAERAV